MALERKEIDAKYKWDLTKIYPSEEAFDRDVKHTEELISTFGKHESGMLSSAEGLFAALSDMQKIERRIETLWCYAYLTFATDTSVNSAQANVARVRTLAVKANSASWFVGPYLIRLDPEKVKSWLCDYPPLRTFGRMIEKAQAEKPYTLSDECEKLVARLGDVFDTHENIRGIFANSDLQFGSITDENGKRVRLDGSNYITYMMKSDRRVRQSAFRTLYKTYEQFGNTFATLYSSYVKEQCALAATRGYKSSLAASTFRDEVTPEIYDSLIKSVRSALPVIHDYYEMKRDCLGIEKFHLYDAYAPLVSESEKKYSYEEAVEEVLKTARIFGDEYYGTLKSGLTERGWVDVYPTKGKQSGAFSSGTPETEPYILLNYNESFNDVSTLAHEAGHSMHSYFSRKYNEPHNSQYRIFVAEVASTVNELLLAHRKLNESESVSEKLSILDGLMETYKATLYRQTMFCEFEKWAHAETEKGIPLTADKLCAKYKRLVRDYFGSSVAVDKQIAYEWMRVPHFFSAFYVYKYATCISAASAIVKRIETEGESYVGKYIDFLKCGDSKSPVESLLVAGIDMTDPAVISGAIEDFKNCIESFRTLYKQ